MADSRSQSDAELPIDPDAPPVRPGRRSFGDGLVAAVLVGVGGLLGTLARYGLDVVTDARTGAWPWGTFTANLAGALALGALVEALARSGPDAGWRLRARLLGGTGFCGGLTTYSTFAVEADLLVRGHRPGLALAYLLSTLVAGLVATTGGVLAASCLRRPRPV